MSDKNNNKVTEFSEAVVSNSKVKKLLAAAAASVASKEDVLNKFIGSGKYVVIRVREIDKNITNLDFIYYLPIFGLYKKPNAKGRCNKEGRLYVLHRYRELEQDVIYPIMFKEGCCYAIPDRVFTDVMDLNKCSSNTRSTDENFKSWCVDKKNFNCSMIFDRLSKSEIKDKSVVEIECTDYKEVSVDAINLICPYISGGDKSSNIAIEGDMSREELLALR